MEKRPNLSREYIAKNITACRKIKHPGRGGQRECAEVFGVLPQQWSPWERGIRTPTGPRLSRICEYFAVTVEWLSTNHGPTIDDAKRAYLKLIKPSAGSSKTSSEPLPSNKMESNKIQALFSTALQHLDVNQPDLLASIGHTLLKHFNIPADITVQIHIHLSSKKETDKAKTT